MGETSKRTERRLLPVPASMLKAAEDSQDGSEEQSPPSGSRKHVTKSACLACQKRKTKCSGERPTCAKCASRGDSCQYTTELLDETRGQALKRKHDELQALHSAYKDIYDSLQASSHEDAEAVLKRIRTGVDAQTMLNQIKDGDIATRSSMDDANPVTALSCFQQLRSWKFCPPGLGEKRLLGDLDESTILTLPPRPLDAYKSQAHEDKWTQIGWTKAHIHHLMDAVFTWDYLPFSLFCHDLFIRDFYENSNRFCSSALVCAVLALASRVVNEEKDDLKILPSGWVGSKAFFGKAKDALQTASSRNIADIQAIGIISLYHLRCGEEVEALEHAEMFVSRMDELRKHRELRRKSDEKYTRVRDVTYCGAVSLYRMLLLTTGKLFNMQSPTPQGNSPVAETLYSATETGDEKTGQKLAFAAGLGNKLLLSGLQLISTRVFELTELVYYFVLSAQFNTKGASSEAKAFYRNCLDWYEDFFNYAENDCGRTPFLLFAHIYYHFCLLCAFRPLVGVYTEEDGIQPHRICKEAAQSVLALVQSYDDLFSLRRVSGLMPYFVCASGLFGMTMETDGMSMNPVHLRLKHHPPGNRAADRSRPSDINLDNLSATSSYITMSATDHARQLLTRMSLAHPVAQMARNEL